jgi:hypothetical protein
MHRGTPHGIPKPLNDVLAAAAFWRRRKADEDTFALRVHTPIVTFTTPSTFGDAGVLAIVTTAIKRPGSACVLASQTS